MQAENYFKASLDRQPLPATVTSKTSPALSYYLPAAVIVLAPMAIRFMIGSAPIFPVDDAYITAHNAQVLHWGHDPNFAGTSALAGATSPFHLALIALLMFLLKPVWAIELAAWLGTLAFALGIARLSRSQNVPPLPALLLAVTGLLAARTPHQLMNGLETGWALAGVTWAIALVSENKTSSSLAFGALCGALPALRPELAALSLLLLPLPAGREWQSSRQVRPALLLLGRCLLAALLALLPWVAWQFAATGSFVPATIAAKRYYFAESGVSSDTKWLWVKGSFAAFLIACGPIALAGLALPFTAAGRAGIAFAAILLTAYYCQFPGALCHYQGRYLYILLPLLLYGAASAFHLLADRPTPRRWAAIFALTAAFQAALLAPYTWREHQMDQTLTRVQLAGVAAWCNANLPPGSRLLIHDAGYISFATKFRMFDIVGLKTPGNIELHRSLTYPSHGRLRAAAIGAAAQRADANYLVVLDLWDSLYKISDGLRQNGWRLEPLRTEGMYRVYRITRTP